MNTTLTLLPMEVCYDFMVKEQIIYVISDDVAVSADGTDAYHEVKMAGRYK